MATRVNFSRPAATKWHNRKRPSHRLPNGSRWRGFGENAMTRISPQPDTEEVLAGLVERVAYHNAENGFCVLRARARGHRDVVTLVGHAATIAAGEWITASGEWVNDRTHGQQFKARFLRTSAPRVCHVVGFGRDGSIEDDTLGSNARGGAPRWVG